MTSQIVLVFLAIFTIANNFAVAEPLLSVEMQGKGNKAADPSNPIEFRLVAKKDAISIYDLWMFRRFSATTLDGGKHAYSIWYAQGGTPVNLPVAVRYTRLRRGDSSAIEINWGLIFTCGSSIT